MTSSADRRDPAGLNEVDNRVIVQTVGFDGAGRVMSLLRQRCYPVQAFSAYAVGDEAHWTVTFTLHPIEHERLLLARLNRLPSVIEAHRA